MWHIKKNTSIFEVSLAMGYDNASYFLKRVPSIYLCDKFKLARIYFLRVYQMDEYRHSRYITYICIYHIRRSKVISSVILCNCPKCLWVVLGWVFLLPDLCLFCTSISHKFCSREPFWFRKITTYPHILSHINRVCPN